MLRFDEMALRHNLGALSKPKQIAFMLLLCERMMPGFQKFSTDTGYDVFHYRQCLDNAWTYLDGRPNPEEMSQECLEGAPDTEEFDHPLTSAALNAALSIGALITFLSEYDVDHIVEAAELARDTVALYVQGVKAAFPLSLSSEEVMRHPFTQRELQRQAEDVAFLASLPEAIGQEATHLLKERAGQASELIPL